MVDLARPSLSSAMPLRAPMPYHSLETADPDTEFAYLGMRLSALLGDAQKAFEGEGFADKLGSMGGGYGSFLPTRSRDRPVPRQDFRYSHADSSVLSRRDAFMQRARAKGSVPDGNKGGHVDVIDDHVDDYDGGGGEHDDGHHHPSGQGQGPAHGHDGDDAILNERNGNNASTTVASSLAVNDAVKQADVPQKKVVLRIKIGSESDIKKKNATLYSHFGLCNSSSSCNDDADDEDEDDDGISDFNLDSSPEKSPMSIIKVMTLSHIPDGRLLSPSLPDLVEENYLVKEGSLSGKASCRHLIKVNGEGKGVLQKERLSSDKGDSLNLIQPGIGGDEPESVKEEKEKVEDSAEKGNGNSKNDRKRSLHHVSKKVKLKRDNGWLSIDRSNSLTLTSKSSSSKAAENRSVKEATDGAMSGSDGLVISQGKSKLDKVPLKHAFREPDNMQNGYCSPFESENNAIPRINKVEKAAPSASQDSNMLEPSDHIGHSSKDVVKETSSSLETGTVRKRPLELASERVRQGKRRSSIKGSDDLFDGVINTSHCEKRKSLKASKPWKCDEPTADESGVSKEASKDVATNQDHWKDPLEEAYPSRGSTTYRGKEHPKEAWKNSTKAKDSTVWDVSKDPSNLELRNGAPEHSSKSFNKGIQKKCSVKSQRIEVSGLKTEEKIAKDKKEARLPKKDASRLFEHNLKESDSQDMQQISFQTPACTEVNSSTGQLNLVGVDPLTAGVLITENWVLCDKCEQWRLLPPGVENEDLPKKWSCKMIYWLQPGMNNCSIPEETTTEATRLLYHNHQSFVPVEHTSIIPSFPPLQVNSMGTAVPSAIKSAGQVIKVDKNRLSVGKKRKVRVTPSNENISGKCANDTQKVCYDASHMNGTFQEAPQARLGVNRGHAQVAVEEKEIMINRRKDSAKDRESKEMEREVKEKEMEREVKKLDREKPEKEKVKKEKEREKKEKEREQEREKEREEKERKEKGREKQREQSRRPKVPCPNDSILPQIIGKDRGQSAAALVVQEALNLKQRAEQLNGKIVFGSEGTNLYFQAALKFLQAASMLEAGDGEIRNESLSISIYSDTAKLCEFCAENYENQNDLAASALAYRCAALAHMRVVQGKSSAVARDRTEMLSYSGESLKSSLPKDSRGALSSSLNSQMGDILIVPEKSRSSFFRLLQFVQSTTAAMEAISKSSHAFNACKESINSSGGLDAMKKVLDMGFHDVESLIRFACVALEATGHRWNH